MSSSRVAAKPRSVKLSSAAAMISAGRSSLRRRQRGARRVFALITDMIVIYIMKTFLSTGAPTAGQPCPQALHGGLRARAGDGEHQRRADRHADEDADHARLPGREGVVVQRERGERRERAAHRDRGHVLLE